MMMILFKFKSFQANVIFLYPPKTRGFMMFSRGIEEDHLPKLG